VVGVMQEMGEIFGQSRDDLLLIPITTRATSTVTSRSSG